MLLLSKADLLSVADRERMIAYIGRQLHDELGVDLPVHPVSVFGADESLFSVWFEREVAPLLARHQELVEASVHRKVASISESVAATLETLLRRRGAGAGAAASLESELAGARPLLDRADEAIRHARQEALDWSSNPATTHRHHPSTCRAGGAVQPSVVGRARPTVPRCPASAARSSQDGADLVGGLHETLRTSFAQLRAAWPFADPANGFSGESKRDGLPVPDLRRFHAPSWLLRPWWHPGSLACHPRGETPARRSVRSVHRNVRRYVRPAASVLDQEEIEQLVERYELEVTPIREQVRRLAASEPGSGADRDEHDRGAL